MRGFEDTIEGKFEEGRIDGGIDDEIDDGIEVGKLRAGNNDPSFGIISPAGSIGFSWTLLSGIFCRFSGGETGSVFTVTCSSFKGMGRMEGWSRVDPAA